MKTPTTLIALLASALTSAAGPRSGSPPNGYTLHEWGTFTTLSASNGALMPGVQREEEPLPEFVESHEGMMHHSSWRAAKGWMRPLANVTVRMETPVIYFYTKDAFDARVEVGFKGGSISQWFPSRTSGETPPTVVKDPQGIPLEKENTIDFARGYHGSIRWDVTVTPPGEDAAGRVFKPGETPSWIYPRHPDSAIVSTKNGQSENYLFYRGLGNFTLPVTFSSSGTGRVTIKNNGSDDVSGLLVYELTDDMRARWSTCETVQAGATVEIDLTGKNPLRDQWRAGVYTDTVSMLTRAGLNRKEADAMVQTWWPSYFERSGLRVFWTVPRKFTDSILPLNVTPAPKETVRVLVGRSEVMTPEFEQRLATDFEGERGAERWSSDRYFPAYQQRVEQLRKGTAKSK
jgi:hypothetical protein